MKLQHVLQFPIWCTMWRFWTNFHFRLHPKCAIWQVFFSWKQHNFLFRRFHSKVHAFWEGHKFLRNLHRRFVLCSNGQIYDGDFAKFCGLLRIYELYKFTVWLLVFCTKKLRKWDRKLKILYFVSSTYMVLKYQHQHLTCLISTKNFCRNLKMHAWK